MAQNFEKKELQMMKWIILESGRNMRIDFLIQNQNYVNHTWQKIVYIIYLKIGKKVKKIYDIADFHQKFEYIHPFQDGNGRIGRFIILRQCLENNIDLIAIDNMYDKEYRKALYKAQTTGNIEQLVNIFKMCQKRFDEKLQSYIPIIKQVQEEVEES